MMLERIFLLRLETSAVPEKIKMPSYLYYLWRVITRELIMYKSVYFSPKNSEITFNDPRVTFQFKTILFYHNHK